MNQDIGAAVISEGLSLDSQNSRGDNSGHPKRQTLRKPPLEPLPPEVTAKMA